MNKVIRICVTVPAAWVAGCTAVNSQFDRVVPALEFSKAVKLGKTDDFSILIDTLKQWEPNTPIAAIGFSQGANMLLKYLGEHEDTRLTCAIAVSPPFQLRVIANQIRRGISKFYQWYLLRSLRAFYRAKFAYRQAPFDLKLLDQCYSFWQFDDEITAKVSGFENAIDYYRQASCINYLKNITVPTLIIHSKDDTIMTPDIIPDPEQLSSSTILELSDHGGHLGFVSGTIFKPKFWLTERIPCYLQHYLPVDINSTHVNSIEVLHEK